MRLSALVLSSLTITLALSAPAWGHGDLRSSTPAGGERVRNAPAEVRATLGEPPAEGSTLAVRDGCGRDVAGRVTRDGNELVARVGPGEPGPWQVRIRSISAIDGHAVKEGFAFEVAGRRDCNREEPPTDDESPEVSSGPRIDGGPGDDGSSFPWVPVGIGTVVLVGLALLARRGSSDS